jgi:site-specific DNA recombinase
MQRVAIYVRVSTEEQAKEGFSISAQRQRLMSYAESMGWDIYDIYIDEGYSGAKADRPELNRLRADIKNKAFDLVLVWKVDRFFRSVYYLSEIIHQMDNSGIGFVSMTESFNTATPSGKAMLQMLAIFAEFERETIRERVRENLAERARQGLHHGPVPYGYTRDEKKNLVIVPEQAIVVKRIFELRSKGKSYNDIRKDVEKRYSQYLHTKDSNTLFYFIVRMLENPVYCGQILHRGNPMPGTHEAIITDELFKIVNTHSGSRHKEHFYLFQWLMFCGTCGSRMTSKTKKEKYNRNRVYYCPNTRMKNKPSGVYSCDGKQIRESIVLQQLVEYLNNFVVTIPEDVEESNMDSFVQRDIDELDKKISDLRKRKNRYFMMFEEDPDFEEEAKDRIKELTASIRELEHHKNELEQSLVQSAATKQTDLTELKDTVKEISEVIEQADEQRISEIVRLFFDKIIVHKADVKPAPGRAGSYIEPIWIQDI